MKKMIAAAAALILAATAMGFSSSADETELVEEAAQQVIEWNDELLQEFVDEGFSGEIFTIDGLGLRLLVPEGLEQRQPTDEEKEQDTILVFENEDQTKKIEFVLGPISDCQTLDDVKAFMEEAVPGLVITPTKINEFDTLVYGSGDTDSMAVLIGAGDAGFLRVICRPIRDQEMYRMYTFTAASLQKVEEE